MFRRGEKRQRAHRARLLRGGVLIAHEEHRRHTLGLWFRPEGKVGDFDGRSRVAAATVRWVGRRDSQALPALSLDQATALNRKLLVAPSVAVHHLHVGSAWLPWAVDVDTATRVLVIACLHECAARACRELFCSRNRC